MPDLNERIALAAERLGVVAAERRHVVVTAESCTGGGIAAAITFGCLFALIAKPKSKS